MMMVNFKKNILLLLISSIIVLSCSNFDTPKYLNPKYSVDQRTDDLLKRMKLEEKIGQMMQIDKPYIKNISDIGDYCIGSILYGGGSNPADKKAESWLELNKIYQEASLNSRLKIPLLIGIDAVHGNAKIENSTIFPHNIGMGCTNDPEIVKKAASITKEEMLATGIYWTFAPCLAVVQDERWGRTYESYSENPEIVAKLGKASILGLQSEKLSAGNVLACAKHFVGDGATYLGIDQGDAKISEEILRKIHLKPYQDAISGDIGSIMISFSSWNDKKLHANKYLITEVLKNELGFNGLVVSDWGGYKQIAPNLEQQILLSCNAGIDMFMVPDIYPEFLETLLKLVKDKKVSNERIDDAVKRILKIKFRLGLFENSFGDEKLIEKIGSGEHRAIARELVRKSTVLLKNNNNILPLTKNIKRIHVAGKSANNIGFQCGGWTLSWQGVSGNVTNGTTILDAVKESVSKNTIVTFSEDGKDVSGADVCIVAVGETPYAENEGDSKNLTLSTVDIETIKNVKKTGTPMIVVLITGRPLIITDYLEDFNALLCAWLPGTEGNGITDIIFGDYNPTAKLSFTWPKSMSQIPINFGDAEYNPLFPFGYGLSF